MTLAKPTQQTSEVVIVRKTYSLAGQLIATRVSGSPNAAENGLFYHYSDHLGSAPATQTIANASGNVVSNARYYPFGEYRTSPTSNITELGRMRDRPPP